MIDYIKKAIDYIGNKIPDLTNSLISKIEDSGFVVGNISSRILSIIVILSVTWIILKLAKNLKKPLVWIIKILSIVLIVSIVIATFITG